MNHDKLPPHKLNVKARISIIVLINLSTITVRVMEQNWQQVQELKEKQRPNRYWSCNSNCSVWHSFLISTLFLLVRVYHACVLWRGQCLNAWWPFLYIITLQNKHGNNLEFINITRFLGTESYVSVSSRVRRNKHVTVIEIKTKCKIITQRWRKMHKKNTTYRYTSLK